MNIRPMALTLAVSLGILAAQTSAQEVSCYSQAIPMPPVRQQTILLIDLTTPAAEGVVESFRHAAMAAAKQPGQRFVILSFAGIAPGQRLTKHLDHVVEAPIVDPALIENLPIRAFQKSQACVRDTLKAWPATAAGALAQAFSGRGRESFQRSEIIHALAETLRNFATPDVPTRLLVYGDGLQHGGISFYGRDKRPRKIDANAELARLPQQTLAPPVQPLGPLKVLWWGLLVEDGIASGGKYYDSETIAQLRLFWIRLLTGWGSRDVQIEQTVLNPRLEWAAQELSAPSTDGRLLVRAAERSAP